MFDVWMTLNASHTGVESFICDDRLLKALPYIPYLELQIVSSGIDNIGVVIIPGYTPRFVSMGSPGTRGYKLARLIRLKQR
jgi:hypothetical protein